MAESAQSAGGVVTSIRRAGSSLLGLFGNRVELLAVEWQEEKLRALRLLAWLVAALFFLVAGGLVALGALGLFLWRQAGYLGLGGLALAALATGALLWWRLRREIAAGPAPFADTVAELRKDAACLRSRE